MLDFKKHSVLEYNKLFQELYNGENPTIHFTLPVLSITRKNDHEVTITFSGNSWIVLHKFGWDSYTYDADCNDVLSSRQFFYINRKSESIGLSQIGYMWRPSKGITYKHFRLNGCDINRNEQTRASVYVPRQFSYRVEVFKKYKEYYLSTHCGLCYYEKISSKGITSTCIRVKDGNDEFSLNLSKSSSKQITMIVHKNFKNHSTFVMNFKNCDIANIYNKYLMFNFDMTANPEVFEIVEKVRVGLKTHLINTNTRLNEQNKSSHIIWSSIKSLEVMENDEYQIQGR